MLSIKSRKDGEMECVEQNGIGKLINIASIVEPTTHEYMLDSVAQNHPMYYVDIHVQFLQSLTLNLSL
jgi:hypothetical protein